MALCDLIQIETTKVKYRLSLSDGFRIAKSIIKGLKLKYVNPTTIKPDYKGERNIGIPVGSIRRQEQTIGDVDILVTKQIKPDDIKSIKGFTRFINKGDKFITFDHISHNGIVLRQVNIFILTDLNSFGAMLLHTTGPAEYNRNLRKVAKDQGLMANQYGVYKDGKQIGGKTEESYYKAIKTSKFPEGKKWKDPSSRGKD